MDSILSSPTVVLYTRSESFELSEVVKSRCKQGQGALRSPVVQISQAHIGEKPICWLARKLNCFLEICLFWFLLVYKTSLGSVFMCSRSHYSIYGIGWSIVGCHSHNGMYGMCRSIETIATTATHPHHSFLCLVLNMLHPKQCRDQWILHPPG